mgnify:CR=1 FL=1
MKTTTRRFQTIRIAIRASVLALAMIGSAYAMLEWAPGHWTRAWIFPLVLGVVLLVFGGTND